MRLFAQIFSNWEDSYTNDGDYWYFLRPTLRRSIGAYNGELQSAAIDLTEGTLTLVKDMKPETFNLKLEVDRGAYTSNST